MKLTAIDLIEKILEFKAMTPNQDEWVEHMLINNKPRLVRLQQLKSLLFAFGIIQLDSQKKNSFVNSISKPNYQIQDLTKVGILSVLNGDFIKKRELSSYEKPISYIEQNSFKKEPVDIYQLESFYYFLMQYRINIYSVFKWKSNVLEASVGFHAVNILTKEINNKISENIKVVDNFLIQIISHQEKEFSEQELIDNYNFPKDDLLEIDIENM